MIYNFDDYSRIFESDVIDDWSYTINISDIYSQYKGEGVDFVKKYWSKLNSTKTELIKTKGVKSWNELVKLMNEMNEKIQHNELQVKDIHPIYDKIYDWADENDILIKTT